MAGGHELGRSNQLGVALAEALPFLRLGRTVYVRLGRDSPEVVEVCHREGKWRMKETRFGQPVIGLDLAAAVDVVLRRLIPESPPAQGELVSDNPSQEGS